MFAKHFALSLSRIVLPGALFLVAAPAQAQVEYTYTGSPFVTADPPWTVGEQVTGSFTVAQALQPFQPSTELFGQLLDFSFTDGVQTYTPANTTLCDFKVTTDGAGNIKRWNIVLREAPLPPMGSPQRTLSFSGIAGGDGGDQADVGPAGFGPCDDFAFTAAAKSLSPGSWTSSAPPAAVPTDYSYTGAPYVAADPPWTVGEHLSGSISFAGPLPPFMPPTELGFALDDFSFSDGVRTYTPANTTICDFKLATDGAGNIKNWVLFLREAPTPPMGSTQGTFSSGGSVGFGGADIAGEGPAQNNACDSFSQTALAESAAIGTWTSSNPLEADPTDYFYTGSPFVTADPPWTIGDRISGSVHFSGKLPPFLPLTDMTFALDDFSFSDGVQTRTLANSSVCSFQLSTDGAGNIRQWSFALREAPLPSMGSPQRTLSSGGIAGVDGSDQSDEGPAGFDPCGDFAFTAAGKSFSPGSWTSSTPPVLVPAEYAYTGEPFTDAQPPWTVSNRVTGFVRLAGALPPAFSYTNIDFAIEDFSFSDGGQTRTPANSTVCDFSVATDAEGDIRAWFVWLRESPTPNFGEPQLTLDSGGSFAGVGFDSVGVGMAGSSACDNLVLSPYANNFVQGSWVRRFEPGPAKFNVRKDFSDDNDARVDVTLTCNTGVPMMQPASISETREVNFVVLDFDPGAMSCEVTEVVPDGYTASYDDGTPSPINCQWENIGAGQYSCFITNHLDPVEVEVSKVWINENPEYLAPNEANATWTCDNVRVDGGPDLGEASGLLQFIGNPGEDFFFVYPDWDTGTTCSINEFDLLESEIVVDQSDCQDLLLFPDSELSCTLYNTRLFAGIPALSRQGLALLVLVMLGLGLVAVRRFG